MKTCHRQAGLRGFTLLEVLVTIVILAIGLLGVAGMQARIQVVEVEAYQRAQAIILLQDMVDRITAGRKTATDYVTGTTTPLGTGQSVEDCLGLGYTGGFKLDLCEWNNALLGAAETKGGSSVGAMIGARGCITNPVTTMPREFVVAVVWQGVAATVAPKATDCGKDKYDDDGKDWRRRAMIARVVIGCLQNDPATGQCVTP